MRSILLAIFIFWSAVPAFAQVSDATRARAEARAKGSAEDFKAAQETERQAQAEFERQTRTLFGIDIKKMGEAQDALNKAKRETRVRQMLADDAAKELQGMGAQ